MRRTHGQLTKDEVQKVMSQIGESIFGIALPFPALAPPTVRTRTPLRNDRTEFLNLLGACAHASSFVSPELHISYFEPAFSMIYAGYLTASTGGAHALLRPLR